MGQCAAGSVCDGGVPVSGGGGAAGGRRDVSGVGDGDRDRPVRCTLCGFRHRHLEGFKVPSAEVVRMMCEMGPARFGKLSIDRTKVWSDARERTEIEAVSDPRARECRESSKTADGTALHTSRHGHTVPAMPHMAWMSDLRSGCRRELMFGPSMGSQGSPFSQRNIPRRREWSAFEGRLDYPHRVARMPLGRGGRREPGR